MCKDLTDYTATRGEMLHVAIECVCECVCVSGMINESTVR